MFSETKLLLNIFFKINYTPIVEKEGELKKKKSNNTYVDVTKADYCIGSALINLVSFVTVSSSSSHLYLFPFLTIKKVF
jgi:hypothetical protein